MFLITILKMETSFSVDESDSFFIGSLGLLLIIV